MINQQELASIRAATKGCAHLIHFNNAGASLPPDVVTDTVCAFLEEEALNGGYETEERNMARFENVYALIAQLINAGKDEVAIFENASAAWGTAFKGLRFEPGDEIITCEMEYVTNLIGLVQAQQTKGVKVHFISNDANGNFPLQALQDAITPRTKLIAITHIPSSGGSVLPIAEIGEIAAKHQVLYMVDACQTAGQFPIDVEKIRCDILSATGRKFLRAPRGTGFLYVRRSVQDKVSPLLVDFLATAEISLQGYVLRNDARRYELYEKNRGITLGLGKAVEYALELGVDRIWQRVQSLGALLRTELRKIPGVTVHDVGDELCGIVTFSVEGIESRDIKLQLAERHINVSVGVPQATLVYMEKRGLKSIVRASVHYYNSEEEVAVMCRELAGIVHPF